MFQIVTIGVKFDAYENETDPFSEKSGGYYFTTLLKDPCLAKANSAAIKRTQALALKAQGISSITEVSFDLEGPAGLKDIAIYLGSYIGLRRNLFCGHVFYPPKRLEG